MGLLQSKHLNLCFWFLLSQVVPLPKCSSRRWSCDADLRLPKCTCGEHPLKSVAFENLALAFTRFTGCFRRSLTVVFSPRPLVRPLVARLCVGGEPQFIPFAAPTSIVRGLRRTLLGTRKTARFMFFDGLFPSSFKCATEPELLAQRPRFCIVFFVISLFPHVHTTSLEFRTTSLSKLGLEPNLSQTTTIIFFFVPHSTMF